MSRNMFRVISKCVPFYGIELDADFRRGALLEFKAQNVKEELPPLPGSDKMSW